MGLYPRIIPVALLLSCLASADSSAGWINDGVPLAKQLGSFSEVVVISDGSRGEIAAFEACYLGSTHVLVQRIDGLGTIRWSPDGVALCAAAENQEHPRIASDGNGGAIIAWLDHRGGSPGVYAQRVDSLGSIQWGKNGVGICTAIGDRDNVCIASDGSGGALVAWRDKRNGNHDVFAQRVDALGEVQWAPDGVAVCLVAGVKDCLQICGDGLGGAIITWEDSRDGNNDIYVQRVNASGDLEWTADGVAVCTAARNQSDPQIIPDADGGAIIAWSDTRNTYADIYAQRINASGVVQWLADGVGICTIDDIQILPQMVPDGLGGAVVTWQDHRGHIYDDIYAQRISASGAIQWVVGGVAICTASYGQFNPQIAADGASGAIITWKDDRNGISNIYAQRVNALGAIRWGVNCLPVCVGGYGQNNPNIISNGAGGAIIGWYDDHSGPVRLYYAQRVDSSGAGPWRVPVWTATLGQESPQVVSDGDGGAIIAWQYSRWGNYDIYAQRLDAQGRVQWSVAGTAVCTASGDQQNPRIVSDGTGGAIVTWEDFRGGSTRIYAQRLNALGVPQWLADGVRISAVAGNFPAIISDGNGGAIITWQGSGIYVQRVDASGAVQWVAGGTPLCAIGGNYPQITLDGAGGAIVTWQDARNSNWDIYAQRVDASGAVQWWANGMAVCWEAWDQVDPQLISDGAGGAIITWADQRTLHWQIYAQRVNSSGGYFWKPGGVALCPGTVGQQSPQIISDGANGALITWADYRYWNNDVYAQRVNPSGAILWAPEGVALCNAINDQYAPRIISDENGGAIVTWYDERPGNLIYDIYAQRVDTLGTVHWVSEGVALCSAAGSQEYPQITSDGDGGAIITWEDGRCGSPCAYAQRIRASGEIVATLLQDYAATLQGGHIRVNWTLFEVDEDSRFAILRAASSAGEFEELKSISVEKSGLDFSFTDQTCLPGSTYKYRVDFEAQGNPRRCLFETEEITIPPFPLTLCQNVPNPFNPSTLIRFYLPETHEVALDIYDPSGSRIARLVEGKKEQGFHEISWNGRNSDGRLCASGVYFCSLKAGKGKIVTRKIVILR